MHWSRTELGRCHRTRAESSSLNKDSDHTSKLSNVGPSTNAPVLSGVSFTVKPGELLVVVGPVGSCKSTLLQGLLGETHQSGEIQLPWRHLAYCPQQAWLKNATLRDNITFGQVRVYLQIPFSRVRIPSLSASLAIR